MVSASESSRSKARRERRADRGVLRLRIVANDSTVMVPRSNTTSVGLRRIMSKKEIDQVYDV